MGRVLGDCHNRMAAEMAAKPSTETELYGTRDVKERLIYRILEPNGTQ